MKKCVVCKKEIPDRKVRLMYQRGDGKIIHFHQECEKEFDREKVEK
jgi:ribosomal protein L24E